jgi:hypothetical protein
MIFGRSVDNTLQSNFYSLAPCRGTFTGAPMSWRQLSYQCLCYLGLWSQESGEGVGQDEKAIRRWTQAKGGQKQRRREAADAGSPSESR